jgi:hypothetical protein
MTDTYAPKLRPKSGHLGARGAHGDAQPKQKGEKASPKLSADAKKGGHKHIKHQGNKGANASHPGVERHIMDLSGPRAFELRPKKPGRDEIPQPMRPHSVNSGRRTRAAILKNLSGRRI